MLLFIFVQKYVFFLNIKPFFFKNLLVYWSSPLRNLITSPESRPQPTLVFLQQAQVSAHVFFSVELLPIKSKAMQHFASPCFYYLSLSLLRFQ